MNDEALLEVIRQAAKVLARRTLLLVGMVMTFILACWAMIDPSYGHLIAAGGFGVLVWVFTSVPPFGGS